MQFTGARGSRDIDERRSLLIVEHDIREKRAIRWIAGSHVDVRISIVVQIAEVTAHGHENFIQPGLPGHVAERSVTQVLV
jgi:hypothetical protein